MPLPRLVNPRLAVEVVVSLTLVPTIGRERGLTRERIGQIEGSRRRKLRALLRARGVDPADLF